MNMPIAGSLPPASPHALGAHWDGRGIAFALASLHAKKVELCLFDEAGERELARLDMPACDNGIWHGHLDSDIAARAGVRAEPGLVYGYRVHGDYAPSRGHRFNPAKVLLDPYAREVVGRYLGQDAFRGDDPSDTAAIALKGRVIEEKYDWREDARPDVPAADLLIYEMHLKGFTMRHPGVPAELRGTYAGLAHPAALDHLQGLGINCVSLLPVHHRADEARLQKMGLSNYWGYSPIAFFAPETRYWSRRPGTTPISEFRDMVRALHGRGIEVVLDVVYNHTGETDEAGPTLSLRGIDNAIYYHLWQDDPQQYENWTGCGNALNLSHPATLRLVLDSLRYWVQEMHVDGFRFDLAPTLARAAGGRFAQEGLAHSAFLMAVMQDPVLRHVRLIAEPWDIGPEGYRLGGFPAGWLEWNDKYRDTMRSFWLHRAPPLGEFAQRLAASSDIFRTHGAHEGGGRGPLSSVNYLASHDGFTLQDLVSYDHKHNLANGERNHDGHSHNHSWNCGAEGPSDDPVIAQRRARLKRAMLATLFFSQGTPMLLAGDEFGQTQQGNNNAYCQDNDTTWLDWEHADAGLSAFVARLSALRREHPALRHDRWHRDAADDGIAIGWFAPDGNPMDAGRWSGKSRLAVRLSDLDGGADCLLLFNADPEPARFALPEGRWMLLLDSADPGRSAGQAEGEAQLEGHAVALFALNAAARASTRESTQKHNS